MNIATGVMIVIGGWLLGGTASADVLELKNGTILNGSYAGGSAGTLRFNTSAGLQVFETARVISLTFTSTNPPSAAAPVSPVSREAAGAAIPGQTVTLPAGTTLLVRTMDGVSSRDKSGAVFTTKLEYDLTSNNVVAVKSGSIVYGRIYGATQARRAVGQSTLDLRLTQIVINGQPKEIVTSSYREAGNRSIGKAAKGAGAGAAIGAIAGDAGKGAAIGTVGGVLIRGDTVTITPGTLLEFRLTQPLTLPVVQ